MKNKIRLLAVSICCLFCCAILAGCGGQFQEADSLGTGTALPEEQQLGLESPSEKADEFTEGQNELRESEKQELLNNVKVLHESFYNIWERESEDCILHLDCVPDAESALLFGDALLRQFQRDGSFPRYAPHQISYQADPEIWIISCWEDLGPYSTSASVNFAIRADDAQVVSIYLGE